MDDQRPILVVELPEFESSASKLFSAAERSALIAFLAEHPDHGDVIPETGGVRKIRWKSKGKGKRGGARVIYFFHAAKEKVYLFTAYGKGQKDDLTAAEKKLWKQVIELLVKKKED